MHCKKAQNLLMTSYLDGLGTEKERLEIKKHLAGCLSCRKLEERLLAQHKILQHAKAFKVPDHLWQNIQNRIISEGLKERPVGALELVKRYIFSPRPAVILTGALTVLIMVAFFAGTAIQKKQLAVERNNIEKAVAYYYSLSSDKDEGIYGFGSRVEEYFL